MPIISEKYENFWYFIKIGWLKASRKRKVKPKTGATDFWINQKENI